MTNPARTIGSSKAAALLDRSPWITRWALHQWMAGRCDLDGGADDERKRWGRLMQPIILAEVARRLSLTVVENERTITLPLSRRSATLDADIFAADSEHPGIVECKTMDRLEWLRYGEVLPIQYELQVQWQFLVTGRTWGRVALLVGGNELLILDRAPEPRVMRALADAADAMVAAVRDGAAPPDPAGLPMELPLLRQAYPLAEPTVIRDLGYNEPAAQIVSDFQRTREARLGMDRAETAAKVALLQLMGDAAAVIVHAAGTQWRVTRTDSEVPAGTIHRRASKRTTITVKQAPSDARPRADGELGGGAEYLDA